MQEGSGASFFFLSLTCFCRPELERCRHSGRPEGHTGWEESSDPEGANWTNMACQLHSQSRVSRLWQAEHAVKNYSSVIYARPDVLYNCYFPVEHLLDIQVHCPYVFVSSILSGTAEMRI